MQLGTSINKKGKRNAQDLEDHCNTSFWDLPSIHLLRAAENDNVLFTLSSFYIMLSGEAKLTISGLILW